MNSSLIFLLVFVQVAFCNQTPKLLCVLNSECNDNNECTIDTCVLNICVYAYASSGTPCEDGFFCTEGDQCNGGGSCLAGTQPKCSGQCNSFCNETAKTCFNPVGSSCDDHVWCNGQDFCDGTGSCLVHTGNPCANSTGPCTTTTCSESRHCLVDAGSPCTSDGNQCTSDMCDTSGTCLHTSLNGTICDDGVACTINDMCSGTECTGSWNPTCTCSSNSGCDDNNICTIDICSNGTCIHNSNDGISCDDGNWCNGYEVCDAGVCQAGTPPCDASSPCNGTCNNSTRTCHTPFNTVCNDNNFCNGNDFCDGAGLCVPSNVSPCEGQCTTFCNETLGVCADPQGTACDDGLFCNGADTCDGSGYCVPSGVDPCEGLPQCQDKCDEAVDACVNTTTVQCQGDFCGGAIWMCLSGVCSAVGERCNSSYPICDEQNQLCYSNSTETNSTVTTGTEDVPITSPTLNPAEKSSSKFVVIGASAGGGVVLLGGICVGGVCATKARKKKNKEKPQEGQEEKGIPDIGFYADISGGVSNTEFLWATQINGVVILNHIGSGNFGEVYKGVWQKEKELPAAEVALKTLKHDDQFTDFVEEAAMLSQLDHQNIVKYFGIFVQKEKYIVTEFMNRGSLLELLHSANFAGYDCKEMALGAAQGMAYLHSKSVIHRDLACRNILVSFMNGSYTAKISDFGMARAIERYYYSMSNQIPIRWSAPEVLCYKKYSPASDVWSFGICLWEIYSRGEDPYIGMSNQEVVNIVQQGHRLSKPVGCPDPMYTIMRLCWHEDRHQRPTFDELVKMITEADINKITELPRTVSTTKAVISKFMEAARQQMSMIEQPATIFEDDSLPPSYGADTIPMQNVTVE